jgi:hypothetical protein
MFSCHNLSQPKFYRVKNGNQGYLYSQKLPAWEIGWSGCDVVTGPPSRARNQVATYVAILLLTSCSLQAPTEHFASALACGWEQRAQVTTPSSSDCWEAPDAGVALTPAWTDSCQVDDYRLEQVGAGETVRLWTRITDTTDREKMTMKACG